VVLARYARPEIHYMGALCLCSFADYGCIESKIEVEETVNKNFDFSQAILAPPSKWRPWHVPCLPYPRYAIAGMTLQRTAWIRLNRLRTGVRRFRSCLHKWGVAPSAACECSTEEQTVDHVILHSPIHRPPQGHGVRGLTILDDETIEWLLNT